MSRFLITTLIGTIILFVPVQDRFTLTEILNNYDPGRNLTTVLLPSKKVSGPKGRYHSLSYSIYYSYPGKVATLPRDVNFELTSVVKARRLNTDLYVVFLLDGREIHFGSSRSAIRNPVPGKPWIGERMVFHVPREDFLKLAEAKHLGVKLGDVSFEFAEETCNSIKAFAKTIRDN